MRRLGELPQLRPALEAAEGPSYPLDAVRMEAPITGAQKFLGIGMNYRGHAEEPAQSASRSPESQMWFNKQVSCINGLFDPVVAHAIREKLDYEVELGVVIGQRCRNVKAADARAS